MSAPGGQQVRVLITGIGGQDGFYLSLALLRRGHCVFGIHRHDPPGEPLATLVPAGGDLQLLTGDVTDRAFLRRVVEEVAPEQIYNLAAQSRVGQSFAMAERTFEVNALAPLYLLEIIRERNPRIRFFQACSAEVFGECPRSPQDESTPFAPVSPYAIAKASAYWLVNSYRRSSGLFACSAILYNHESPLRDESFLSGKVVRSLARILVGQQQTLALGNLKARRDWGFAGDYVEAMVAMMAQAEPEDYVIASGEVHSVGEFVEEAFGYARLDWRKHVVIDAQLLRVSEAHLLLGNAGRARERLGWQPRLGFQALVRLMVDSAIEQVKAATLSAAASREH
ncbi:GDP-mannose 4,6-dehydratase [Gloeobacter morelensis MG652769]|uniref:GDP-mannose 4,6-dehydratase n=1 Tax=Gloeobacter morelensis MG652769 TaxID=2781736 RepID=A0ABY3PT15_9CYAN|nr:GDP-mannose 4,6-dehydratase [Gloeobacter morelensis MG652769]